MLSPIHFHTGEAGAGELPTIPASASHVNTNFLSLWERQQQVKSTHLFLCHHSPHVITSHSSCTPSSPPSSSPTTTQMSSPIHPSRALTDLLHSPHPTTQPHLLAIANESLSDLYNTQVTTHQAHSEARKRFIIARAWFDEVSTKIGGTSGEGAKRDLERAQEMYERALKEMEARRGEVERCDGEVGRLKGDVSLISAPVQLMR